MSKFNEIEIKKWREYSDIFTDSLWLINRRDNSGVHSNKYHGNFIPQIPFQMLQRYTKKNEWVLDPFMGSGTTLIEAQRLNRNAIGIELQKSVADEASSRIKLESKPGIVSEIVIGDSSNVDYSHILQKYNIDKVQFIIFHPPYWDIIKFSDDKNDLSNSNSKEEFLCRFESIIDSTTLFLEDNRYCCLVIGDKYSKGELIPLGFECMQLFLNKGFTLKAIIVKNIGETSAKGKNEAIWRYRALSSDYYVFKHEYVMVFKKNK